MQPEILVLLLALTAFAGLSYHLGFRLEYHVFQHLSKASFVFLTFVLIPIVIYVLAKQSGATDRLAETGVIPHPALGSAQGAVFGGGGRAPKWLFDIAAPPESVIAFYRRPENRPSWEITTDSGMVILRRGDQRMTIMPSSEGKVYYTLDSVR